MKILIAGAGWLGFPLAYELKKSGFDVYGSTRSKEKAGILKFSGINAFITEDPSSIQETDFDLLIINLPPSGFPDYGATCLSLASKIHPSGKIIFISSTGVYENASTPISENGKLIKDSELVKTEILLQTKYTSSLTIIRFGGLIGYDRHPVRHLSKKEVFDNPEAPVNLIHRDDCIAIIQKIIHENIFGLIINACSPEHPSGKDYYSNFANHFDLSLPPFRYESRPFKSINSDFLVKTLNYNFIRSIFDKENYTY